MSDYYDRKGNRLSGLEEWGVLHQCMEYKRVAITAISDEVTVSTVWLGMNHRFGDGPPLIFETMVFGGPLDQEMDRYSTEEQALEGHEAMVAKAKDTDDGT